MIEPPPPPPAPPADLRPWLAFASGAMLVLVIALIWVLMADGDPAPDDLAATTAVPTTAAVTTTEALPAATTTVVATTTTIPPDFEDSFEGSSPLAVIDPSATLEVTADGRGRITATQSGVGRFEYPVALDLAKLQFTLTSDAWGTGTRFGVLLFLDPDRHYLSIAVNPASETGFLEFVSLGTADGVVNLMEVSEARIPAEAGFDPSEATAVSIVIDGGGVTVSINGVAVTTWNGTLAATAGTFGFILYADAAGHTMIVDDVMAWARK
ncbi:MAG: hypothetical protein QY307_04105 [Acidimicrobiia bacterium]|nr:MAG: hypothetical protein QY307_04105 [Acidimicrobiia bacterium]